MTDLPKIMQFLFVFCRYLCLKYLDLPRIISVKKADTHNKVNRPKLCGQHKKASM